MSCVIKGALLEKGEKYYTRLGKIFSVMNNFQNEYNWLISDCEAYPMEKRNAERINQDEKYAWITGEELTSMIIEEDFLWIWGVLSGFEKKYTKEDVCRYSLPYADGYEGFWNDNISIQHPLASIELVAWDSSCTLFISKNNSLVEQFRLAFPLSVDLEMHNRGLLDDSEEYEQYLSKFCQSDSDRY